MMLALLNILCRNTLVHHATSAEGPAHGLLPGASNSVSSVFGLSSRKLVVQYNLIYVLLLSFKNYVCYKTVLLIFILF